MNFESAVMRMVGGISMPASVDQSREVNATPGPGTDGPDCFALTASRDAVGVGDCSRFSRFTAWMLTAWWLFAGS